MAISEYTEALNLFLRRLDDPSVVISRGFEADFDDPVNDQQRQIKAAIDEYRSRAATITSSTTRRSPTGSPAVMSIEDCVDAALAGLDLGEKVTMPSVEDKSLLATYDAARNCAIQRVSVG